MPARARTRRARPGARRAGPSDPATGEPPAPASFRIASSYTDPGFALAHVPAYGVDTPGNRGLRDAEDGARLRVAHALGMHQQRGFLHALAEIGEFFEQLREIDLVFGL